VANVLIVGESWVSQAHHVKGWDFFSSSTYHTGHRDLQAALEAAGHVVTHLPSHAAGSDFPLELAELQAHDVVVLSDIGANTLLLHPDTWIHGKTTPNRLRLIARFVELGGGLLMAGGYYSFQGIHGAARFHRTPVEAALPVTMLAVDDRVEEPEGFDVTLEAPYHPLVADMPTPWPPLLGLNEVVARPEATVIASAGGFPLLVLGRHGAGRSAAWTSDVGPHWCSPAFVAWEGYARLWPRLVSWLAGGELEEAKA
jgi:uncharacterized membrane protein